MNVNIKNELIVMIATRENFTVYNVRCTLLRYTQHSLQVIHTNQSNNRITVVYFLAHKDM